MEYLIFGIMAAAFVIAIIAKDIYNDRKKQKQFRLSLRRDYGKQKQKEVKLERFVRIDTYYKKHPKEGQIDDVTWNDLGMDEIFKLLNQTHSSSGEEYLYYVLRTPERSNKELDDLEKVITFFKEHEEERVYVQLLMAKLGSMGKFSLYDYLDNLDYLGERSNKKAWLCNFLLFACFAMIPFYPSHAILAAVLVTLYNIATYFREKGEIEPYVISFSYVIKLLTAAEKMGKMPGGKSNPIFSETLGRLEKLRTNLQKMQKGSFLVTFGNGSMGGNPADLLFDYLKMTLHLDLIKFNNMLAFLRKNVSEVDEVNSILGRYETAIAIGGWRKYLEESNGCCVPKLWESNEAKLTVEEGYHPLLSEPVKNSLVAQRGILLTGSNASGKSTFLKMLAINAIFAQTIHTCTASRYEAPFYRIYSSMSLRDDVEGGDSYYVAEIKAIKRILMAAKEKESPVLCFVDEVLRGTNTVERIAASTQVLKSLAQSHVLCCAATHDVELTELLKEEFDNYHFEEDVVDGDVFFQYRLLAGKASTRNAIKLLEIIGYDEEIVSRAQRMAEDFTETGIWKSSISV